MDGKIIAREPNGDVIDMQVPGWKGWLKDVEKGGAQREMENFEVLSLSPFSASLCLSFVSLLVVWLPIFFRLHLSLCLPLSLSPFLPPSISLYLVLSIALFLSLARSSLCLFVYRLAVSVSTVFLSFPLSHLLSVSHSRPPSALPHPPTPPSPLLTLSRALSLFAPVLYPLSEFDVIVGGDGWHDHRAGAKRRRY